MRVEGIVRRLLQKLQLYWVTREQQKDRLAYGRRRLALDRSQMNSQLCRMTRSSNGPSHV